MDPMAEEQLDYGDEEYGGSQKMQFLDGRGAIPALAEEEMMPEDDEYDDLYNDVNVGESFFQTLQKPSEPPPAPLGNGGFPSQKPDGRNDAGFPGVGLKAQDSRAEQKSSGGFLPPGKGLEEGSGDYPEGAYQKGNSIRVPDTAPEIRGNMGFQGASPAPMPLKIGLDPKFASGNSVLPADLGSGGIRSNPPMPPNRAGLIGSRPVMNENPRPVMGSVESNGQTMLFVGELHWWTTDAEIESVLSQYGRVKEIRFFDERASGKSKGYCQVEFYDHAAASACREGMNGHVFNGRACVVTFASAQTMRQMNAAYMNKTQPQAQSQQQGRRPMNDGIGRGGGGMNYQGGDGGRNFGRGGWGRGGQGFNNRGQGGPGAMRGRGVIGAKSMVGPPGGVGTGPTGNPYGQGFAGPALGGPAGGLMHPQSMMGAGFDPTYMGRGGPYGGFSAPAFPGMMHSFQAVNAIGLPGVAPHVNPAFFGRGMSANGMGMMGSSGMEGHPTGMWTDTSMGGWTVEEHGRRTRESSYGGDDGASDYGYGEVNHERGGRSNVSREKERGSEREWSGNSERRHRDEKDRDWDRLDRDRHREEKDGNRDHRQKDRDWDNDDNYDRGQSSSRSRSKSQMMQEEDHRPRSRDADYGKRRRLPSE